MTPLQRIERTRKVLRNLQMDERRAEMSGPPCVDCAHRVEKVCGHIAYTRRNYDAVRGEFAESATTLLTKARGEDGLCGPEALLFEPIALRKRIVAKVSGYQFVQTSIGVAVMASIVYAIIT